MHRYINIHTYTYIIKKSNLYPYRLATAIDSKLLESLVLSVARSSIDVDMDVNVNVDFSTERE